MRRRRVLIRIPLVVAGVVLFAGTATGRWTATGSVGAGTAAVGNTVPVTISSATTTTLLYPTGVPSGDVSLRLTNPNAVSVRVPRLALDVSRGTAGFAVDSGHTGCSLSSVAYVTQTNGGAGWTVPAGGSLGLDLVNAVSLAGSAPSACQGASLTVYLTS